MADERNNQEDHRGKRKPNPNSGNAEGRNRRNEEAVSYTHLDVYKRQGLERILNSLIKYMKYIIDIA